MRPDLVWDSKLKEMNVLMKSDPSGHLSPSTREKGRDLTRSYEKSPYTDRKVHFSRFTRFTRNPLHLCLNWKKCYSILEWNEKNCKCIIRGPSNQIRISLFCVVYDLSNLRSEHEQTENGGQSDSRYDVIGKFILLQFFHTQSKYSP